VKRFWTAASLAPREGGFGIALDGRPLKTPARVDLLVEARALAEEIVAEWNSCGDEIDPRAMPLTGLANAAIDHVTPRPDAFAADLAKYAQGDLLCYRADHPPKLVEAQAAAWDPMLAWARGEYGVEFVVTTGIMHQPQPESTVAKLAAALALATPFQLAALSPIVTIGGSLVTALAFLARAVDKEAAWAVVTVDDRWQIEQWGADDEAVAALAARRAEFQAAARFLALLGSA